MQAIKYRSGIAGHKAQVRYCRPGYLTSAGKRSLNACTDRERERERARRWNLISWEAKKRGKAKEEEEEMRWKVKMEVDGFGFGGINAK